MKPEFKYSFSFEGIDPQIAEILESKLSGVVSEAFREVEDRVEVLNALAGQGFLEHVDIAGVLNSTVKDEKSADSDESETAPEKVSKPAKKKTKKASAKKVVVKVSSSPEGSSPSGEGATKAAAPESESKYTETPSGRIVRKPKAPGAMPAHFIENVRSFMRKGDDDATLMREHNATKALLDKLRAEEESSAAPEGEESSESIENQAVSLLNSGQNVVTVATNLGITLPEANRIARKHGFN
jgi:hypothetical protein